MNRGVDDGAGAIEDAVMAFARIELDDDRALNRAYADEWTAREVVTIPVEVDARGRGRRAMFRALGRMTRRVVGGGLSSAPLLYSLKSYPSD